MAVLKPRTKLVNFRLSEEEFQNLRQASEQLGARSISDFARSAVLKTFGGDTQPDGLVHVRLSDLDHKVSEIESSMRQLREHLSNANVAVAAAS